MGKSAVIKGGRCVAAYALINYDCDEHRLKEQNLERHRKNIVKPLSNIRFIHFHGCIVSIVSGLFPHPLGFSDKKNGPIGFRNSKEYHDQADAGLNNGSSAVRILK